MGKYPKTLTKTNENNMSVSPKEIEDALAKESTEYSVGPLRDSKGHIREYYKKTDGMILMIGFARYLKGATKPFDAVSFLTGQGV